MTIDRSALFAELLDKQPTVSTRPSSDEISVPELVRRWLASGPSRFGGDDREALGELCRQIDVRRTVSIAYGSAWKKLADEAPAPKAVVSGLVAVLLANGAEVGVAPGSDGSLNDGWGLKCVNSGLKALELDTAKGAPRTATLRAWAFEVLDRMRPVEGGES